jgi:hypothetical protein
MSSAASRYRNNESNHLNYFVMDSHCPWSGLNCGYECRTFFSAQRRLSAAQNSVRQSVPTIQSELPQVRFLQVAGDCGIRRRIRRSESVTVLPTMSRARSHADLLNQILLNRRGAYQFRPFVAHVVECAIDRTPFERGAIRIF